MVKKLCYMDTDSFIVSMKTDDIYKDIADSYQIVIALKKDDLIEKKKDKICWINSKKYSYLKENSGEDRESKDIFENFKNYLEATQHENKISHIEKKIKMTWIVLKNHKNEN